MSYLGFIAEKTILYSTLSVPKFHKIEEVQIILSLNQRRKIPLLHCIVPNKESTETYLLELTPYKGLCVVVCLLNGH